VRISLAVHRLSGHGQSNARVYFCSASEMMSAGVPCESLFLRTITPHTRGPLFTSCRRNYAGRCNAATTTIRFAVSSRHK
jgi:hypothetical protein